MNVNERFSQALHITARVWRLAVDRRLKYLGLSQAGWRTITMVARSDTPLSQSDLAHRLGVEGPTMVGMIDRLARDGLIERSVSSTDRRVKLITLTQAGEEAFERVKIEGALFRDNLLKNFDDTQKLRVAELLEKIQQLVESET
jgi:MarR family transcriptional regulator for hemolysin